MSEFVDIDQLVSPVLAPDNIPVLDGVLRKSELPHAPICFLPYLLANYVSNKGFSPSI